MNGNEISRLAHALNELRPDWPIASLTTWLTRNMAGRHYRDAALACVYVALDLKPDGTWASNTLARVLEAGPWWRAAAAGEQVATRPRPPRRDEQCRRCGGLLPACACTREAIAADGAPPPPPSWDPGDAKAGADLARAALHGRTNESGRA